ncbi:MAG TPA: response regulator [Planctomycetota bacterium]|jgi:DNA-binding NtrC family response regulator|nr:response regulator [Planctomycetota bacterium]
MTNSRPSSAVLRARRETGLPIVLCVDDDGAVLSSLRRLFRGEPYEVVTTISPAQALACLRRRPVSVVISDERMPGTSGSELLAEVRERWPWIGRVILTAYPGHEVMVRGLRAGIDFLLFKPWDQDSFKHTIERLIEVVARTKKTWEAEAARGESRDFGGEGG